MIGVEVILTPLPYEELISEYLAAGDYEAALVDLTLFRSPDPDPYPFRHQAQAAADRRKLLQGAILGANGGPSGAVDSPQNAVVQLRPRMPMGM